MERQTTRIGRAYLIPKVDLEEFLVAKSSRSAFVLF